MHAATASASTPPDRSWPAAALLLCALFACALLGAGCRGALGVDVVNESDGGAPQGRVISVALTGLPASLTVGDVVQLAASALYENGARADVTAQASFSVKDAAVASLDAGHALHALTTGHSEVDLSLPVAGGGTLTASAAFTVVGLGGATVVALAVAPAQVSVPRGQSAQLTATATLSDATTVDATASATWQTSDASVVTVTAGVVTGVAAGSATITAQLSGQSATAQITVSGATLVAVAVAPPNALVAQGLSVALRATALFSDGASSDVTALAAWSSDAPAVATVQSGTAAAQPGLVAALAPGRAQLTASYGGGSGRAQVTVSAATLTTLSIVPAAATIPVGQTTRLRAVGIFSDHSQREVSLDAAWSVSDATIATVDATGLVTAVARGSAQVSAVLDGKTALCPVAATDAALTSILVLPTSVFVPAGLTARLVATGIYSDNTLHDLTAAATWTSDAPTVAAVSNAAGANGTVQGVAVGTAHVIAQVGAVASTGATVTVSGATLQSVALQPRQLLLAPTLTAPLQLFAHYSDGSEYDETSQASFSSDSPATVSVVQAGPGAGLVTAQAAGFATVTGTLQGVSGTARIAVAPAQLRAITVIVPRMSIPLGDAFVLRAQGDFGFGRPQDVTALCTWTSSDPGVVLVGPNGGAVAKSAGTATVSCEVSGISGSAQVTVAAPLPVGLVVQESAFSLPVSVTRALIATATYPDGSRADVTYAADWSSDKPVFAAVGNAGLLKGLVTGVSPGVATVTATLAGVSGTATVKVDSAKAVSLSIAPVNPVVTSMGPMFRPAQFPFYATAHFDDGSDQNVTESAGWTSSDTAVVIVNDTAGQRGRADVLGIGGATVTATFQGLTSSTFLTSR